MAIQYTSPYNLPYPQIGDPVKEGQANMELLAKRVNTVLTDGSFPASNPDVASITARLNALEVKPLVVVELATTDQSIGTAVSDLPIIWNVRTGDTTMNPDANRDRLVAPVAGFYTIEATAIFSNHSGTGQRSVGFRTTRAGVAKTYRGMNNTSPSTAFFTETNATLTVYLSAGDYVHVTVEVTADVTTYVKASQGTRAAMQFIRP